MTFGFGCVKFEAPIRWNTPYVIGRRSLEFRRRAGKYCLTGHQCTQGSQAQDLTIIRKTTDGEVIQKAHQGSVRKMRKNTKQWQIISLNAMSGIARWIKHRPENQRVAGSIPSQGRCLGCGPGLQ